jgi:adenylate kinase
MSELNLVLLGPPGSGKGTQGELLQEDFRLPYYATGDILRAAVREGTELGTTAKQYMDRGDLVPDEVMVGLIAERVSRSEASDGFILDGFPRTIAQAEALAKLLKDLGQALDTVVYFDVSEPELLRRLTGRRVCRTCGHSYHITSNPPKRAGVCDQCGSELYQRADDAETTVRKRLDVYQRQTAPLLDYYRQRSLLATVSGEGPLATIRDSIRAATGAVR